MNNNLILRTGLNRPLTHDELDGNFTFLDNKIDNSGIQGTQGLQGIMGTQGFIGSLGFQGVQGITGFQGQFGTQGIQGTQGNIGIQGLTGTQGLRGFQGFQGTQGRQGFQGIMGETGLVTAITIVKESTIITSSHASIICEATDISSTINLTLPSVADSKGRTFKFKKIDDYTKNNIYLITTDGSKIDGLDTYPITTKNSNISIQTEGTNWHVLSKYIEPVRSFGEISLTSSIDLIFGNIKITYSMNDDNASIIGYISCLIDKQLINMRWNNIYNDTINNGEALYDSYELTTTPIIYSDTIHYNSNETPMMILREWISVESNIYREWYITGLFSDKGKYSTAIAYLNFSN